MTPYLDLSALPATPLTKSRVPDIAFNAAIAAFEGMVFYGGGAYPDATHEGNYWWCGGHVPPDGVTDYGLGPASKFNPPALARYMAAFLQRHPGAPAEALYRQMASEHVALDPDGWSALPGCVKLSYLIFAFLIERLTLLARPDEAVTVPVAARPAPVLVRTPAQALPMDDVPTAIASLKALTGGKQNGTR